MTAAAPNSLVGRCAAYAGENMCTLFEARECLGISAAAYNLEVASAKRQAADRRKALALQPSPLPAAQPCAPSAASHSLRSQVPAISNPATWVAARLDRTQQAAWATEAAQVYKIPFSEAVKRLGFDGLAPGATVEVRVPPASAPRVLSPTDQARHAQLFAQRRGGSFVDAMVTLGYASR